MARLVPTPWIAFVIGLLGGTRKVACALWPHVTCSPTLLFQLGQIDLPPGDVRWPQRCKFLSQTLTPQMILRATLTLAPEGRRRDPDVRRLEQSILDALDREGNWSWD